MQTDTNMNYQDIIGGKHQQFHLQLQQIINAKNKTQKSIDALQNAKNMVKENELKRKIERLKTEKERKERTKRLIEIGAMIESIAGGELDLYKFQSYLNQYKLAISA